MDCDNVFIVGPKKDGTSAWVVRFVFCVTLYVEFHPAKAGRNSDQI